MRHNKKFNHLGRKKAHRDALLANMTTSLILRKRIFTTLAKAKALRVYAEPLINRAKDDSMNNRRVVFSYLQNKEAVNELFREVAKKIADRNGGYTRILKTGYRLGDNAARQLPPRLPRLKLLQLRLPQLKLPQLKLPQQNNFSEGLGAVLSAAVPSYQSIRTGFRAAAD